MKKIFNTGTRYIIVQFTENKTTLVDLLSRRLTLKACQRVRCRYPIWWLCMWLGATDQHSA